MLSVAALIASVALLVASVGVWLIAVGLYLRLAKGVPGAPSVPRAIGGARTEPPDTEIPDPVRGYIEEESEPWAREELKALAKQLYAETGDWSVAFTEMQRVASDLPDGEEF